MAGLETIGAVGIRVRPDARGFRPEAKSQVMSALKGIDGDVPLNPVVDAKASELKAKIDRLARELATDTEVKVKVDDSALARDLERVRREVERSGKAEIKIGDNLDEARSNARELTKQYKDLRKELRAIGKTNLTSLEKSQKNLTSLTNAQTRANEKLMQQQGRLADIQDKIWKAGGEADDKMLARLAKQEAAVDDAKTAYIRAMQARDKAAKDHLKLQKDLEVVETRAVQRLERVRKAAGEAARGYRQQANDAERLLKIEKDYMRIATGSREQVVETIKAQNREGETYLDTLDRILTAQDKVSKIDWGNFVDLREWADRGFKQSSVTHLRVEADTAVAEAQLQTLERSRTVRVLARVDHGLLNIIDKLDRAELSPGLQKEVGKYSDAIASFSKSVLGLKSIKSMNKIMREGIDELQQFSIMAGIATTAIGGLGDAVFGSLGQLSAWALALTDLSKGSAILPAALTAMGFGFAAARKGLGTFLMAAGGNKKAIKQLAEHSELGAKAAEKLFDTFHSADVRGQTKFFENMGDGLLNLSDTLKPVTRLWEDAYDSSGRFFKGVIQGLEEWSKSGHMEGAADNMAHAFQEMERMGKPLMDIFADLTDVGAIYLPRLAGAMADATEQYARFIEKSKQSGDIDAWIVNAGKQFRGLVDTISGSLGIIGAMGDAARRAGYGGFDVLGKSMKAAADELNTGFWQNGMENIFRGAREGIESIGKGFGDFLHSMMGASEEISKIGRVTGDSIGQLLTFSGKMLTNSSMLQGFAKIAKDVNDSIKDTPALFVSLGDSMGQASRVAGEIFKVFMKVAESFAVFWADGEAMTRGLEGAIPVFGQFAVTLVQISHALTGPIISALGYLLQAFNGLPGPLQQAILGFGALGGAMAFLNKKGHGSMIAGLSKQFPVLNSAINKTEGVLKSARGSVESFAGGWNRAMQEIQGGHIASLIKDVRTVDSSMGAMERAGRGFATSSRIIGMGFRQIHELGAPLPGQLGAIKNGLATMGRGLQVGAFTAATSAMTGLKNAAGGLRGAFSGLWGALGGGWGVAIMGIASAVGYFAQKSAESKRHIQELRGSLNELGGTTTETVQLLESGFRQADTGTQNFLNSVVKMEDGKVVMESFGKTAEKTGMSMIGLAQDVEQSGGNWSDYRQNLEDAINTIGPAGRLTEEQAQAFFHTKEAAGLTGDELSRLRGKWDEQNNALKIAKAQQEQYAKAMGLSGDESVKFQKAIEVMNDKMSSSEAKGSALRDVLQILNDEFDNGAASTADYYESMDKLGEAFQQAKDASQGAEKVIGTWTDAAGNVRKGIDLSMEAGRKLDSTLRGTWDSTAKYIQQAYDQAGGGAKGLEAADAIMADWRGKVRKQLQDMGVDAETTNNIINEIAGDPKEVHISLEGGAEVLKKAREIGKTLGDDYDDQKFMAYLEANPTLAEKDIGTVIDKLKKVDSTQAAAKIGAEDKASGKVEGAEKKVEDFDGKKAEAKVDAKTEDADKKIENTQDKAKTYAGQGYTGDFQAGGNASIDVPKLIEGAKGWTKDWVADFNAWAKPADDAVNGIIDKGKDWITQDWSAKINAWTKPADDAVNGLLHSAGDWIKNTWEAIFSADGSGGMGVVTGLTTAVTDWAGQTFTAALEAAGGAGKAVADILGGVGDWAEQTFTGTLNALGDAPDKVKGIIDGVKSWAGQTFTGIVNGVTQGAQPVSEMVGKAKEFGGGIFQGAVNAITSGGWDVGQIVGKAQEFGGGIFQGLVSGLTQGQQPVSDMVGKAKEFGGNTFQSIVSAITQGYDGVTNLRGNIDLLSPKSVLAQAFNAGAPGVGFLRDTVGSLFDKSVWGKGFSWGQSGMENLRGAIHQLFDKTVWGKGIPQGQGGMETLRGSIANLFDKTVWGKGIPQGQSGMETLRGAIANLFDKTVWGRGISEGHRGLGDLRQRIVDLFNKTVRAGAEVFGAGPLSDLKNSISGLAGKTVQVVTEFIDRHIKGRADGAFTPAGASVQSFAYGAIRKGGSGRHPAQIRRPQGPNVTVWNEGAGRGNTAGESYIPHAIGKRSRSTQILGATAREFGLSVVKYSEGGMTHIGGMAPGSTPAGGPGGIDYRRLGRAVAQAMPREQTVRVSNTGDFDTPRRR